MDTILNMRTNQPNKQKAAVRHVHRKAVSNPLAGTPIILPRALGNIRKFPKAGPQTGVGVSQRHSLLRGQRELRNNNPGGERRETPKLGDDPGHGPFSTTRNHSAP